MAARRDPGKIISLAGGGDSSDHAVDKEGKALSLLREEELYFPRDWKLITDINDQFKQTYFLRLKKSLAKRPYFPPPALLYNWAINCPFERVKVVVLGQDPYHNDGQAMGLAFSVPKHCRIPPSLRNIYKELAVDIGGFVTPKHGDLTSWSQQGVLLLNTSLSVEAHKANSHSKLGWSQFTDAIITSLARHKKHIVFILWGNHAQSKASLIGDDHLIIKSVHPSPLSARRGFFGSAPFSRTNAYLRENGIDPIDWHLPHTL